MLNLVILDQEYLENHQKQASKLYTIQEMVTKWDQVGHVNNSNMSKDVYVIANHQLPEKSFSTLVEQLNQLTLRTTRELSVISLQGNKSVNKWEIYQDYSGDETSDENRSGKLQMEIRNGDGLTLYIFPDAFILGTWVRWKEFVNDFEIQRSFRRINLELTKIFKSSRAFYVSDSGSIIGEKIIDMIYEGANCDVIEFVAKQISSPWDLGTKINDFAVKDGYFIEYFSFS